MEVLNAYAKVAVLLFLYFLLSFSYQGIISVPSEGDSLAYHLPIARSVLNGSVFNPSRAGYALEFYPGSAELILAVLMLGNVPLNLYNVLGWVILTFLCFILGRRYKLEVPVAIIYAVTATTVMSLFRLLNNQTIDIWLAVFFTASWILLKSPAKSLRYFFLLGMVIGFLIGAKFSGPVYALLLLLIYGRNLFKFLTPQRGIAFLIPFLIFGISWYFRNFYLTGNPLYPQQFLFLPGNPRFHLMNWVGWQTLLLKPDGWFLMLIAFFSEYLLWFLTPVFAIIVWVKQRERSTFSKGYREVSLLSMLSFLLFFFLPSTPDNIITYLRYLFPAFISGILLVFLLARDKQWLVNLVPLAVMNSALLLTLTGYHPKLLFIYVAVAVLLIIKYDILIKYLRNI